MNSTEQPSFFFFDYETWGVHPAKDRPCQFAGIRTDHHFNIIGEPLMLYCQLPHDYLPNPEAVFITGITPQKAMAQGLAEPEFIARIHEQLAHPNTTSLGYNNIRFDDEVTRYTCYRNFIDPYAWSYKNGNSRWDLLDLARACHALRPEGIQWPKNEDGSISFKLEDLAKANHIHHEHAHDALSDVYATIGLAKLIKTAQPKLFDYFFQLRHKQKLQSLIDIVQLTPLVHVSGMLGRTCHYTSLVLPMAWHPTNKNAIIVVNLAQDLSPLLKLSVPEMQERLYTKHEDLTEDELPLPIKLVHLNKCPILAPAKTLTPENETKIGIDRARCEQNREILRQHPEVREKLVALFSIERDFTPHSDVDSQLYQGFFSPADRNNMDILRNLSPEQLEDVQLSFQDERVAALLFRYRARHYPWTLSLQEQQRWQHHCREYFEQHLPTYLIHLEQLAFEHEQDEKKLALLKALYQYVEQLVS